MKSLSGYSIQDHEAQARDIFFERDVVIDSIWKSILGRYTCERDAGRWLSAQQHAPIGVTLISYDIQSQKTLRIDSQFIAGQKYNLHQLIVNGVYPEAFVNAQTLFPRLGKEEAFGLALGISGRTLSRYKTRACLPESSGNDGVVLVKGAPAENLVQFASVMTLAVEVLGDAEDAETWMLEECAALDNQRPIDMLQTKLGADLVTNLLGQLKHGVYV